jgi:membrane protein required for colicin V production
VARADDDHPRPSCHDAILPRSRAEPEPGLGDCESSEPGPRVVAESPKLGQEAPELGPVDLVALAILGIAALRGLFLGLVREVFSLAALAGAVVAVRWLDAPFAAWLEANTALETLPAQIAAGIAIVIGVLALGALLGRLLRRGVRAAGLGLSDRVAGGLLGAAEGAVVVALLVALGAALFGRDQPPLAGSRTLAAFERAESAARGAEAERDVAAPPPARHRDR